MAVISGYGVQSSVVALSEPPELDPTQNLFSITRTVIKEAAEQRPVIFQSSYAYHQTTNSISNALGSAVASGFAADFYNRIHISPRLIDVGNLVSDQFVTAEIFNAYFVPKELSSLQENGTRGIIISGIVPPATIGSLVTKTFFITVTTEGASDINAEFLFNFEGTTDDIDVKIVGSRIISLLWPFEAPAQESLSWNTDVIKSNNGNEQRIRLRKHPRQQFRMSYPLRWKDIPAAENRLFGWLARRWAVPLWSEAQYIGTINAGVTTINVNTTTSDFRGNSLLYIYDSTDKNFTVEIDTVASGSLTLKLPVNAAYTNAYIMPSRIGRIVGVPVKKSNGYEAALDIAFEFIDNLDLGLGTTPTQFLGDDIYFDETLLGEVLDDQYATRVDVVDYDVGNSVAFSPWTYIKKKRPMKYILQGLSEIWVFRKWLHRRAGQLRPFWIPSFDADIRLNQTDFVTSSLLVDDNDYYAFSQHRNHIAIEFTNYTWVTRTITSISQGAPGLISLALDTTLGNIDPKTIRRICYLTYKRLDTDKIELQWGSNRTLTATIPVIEIGQ